MERVGSISELLRSLVPEQLLGRWGTGRSEKERLVGERQLFEIPARATDGDQLKSLACSLGESSILLIPRSVGGRYSPQDFWNIGYVFSIFARWPAHLEYADQFPIVGPRPFAFAVCRLLSELSQHAPLRFQEALIHLPMAVYDPTVQSAETDGRADGSFALDGSDYDRFRFVFLHEIGHNVAGKAGSGWSEVAADEYALAVLAELG